MQAYLPKNCKEGPTRQRHRDPWHIEQERQHGRCHSLVLLEELRQRRRIVHCRQGEQVDEEPARSALLGGLGRKTAHGRDISYGFIERGRNLLVRDWVERARRFVEERSEASLGLCPSLAVLACEAA